MKTIVIAIGNSDDKLTQKDWARYCLEIEIFVQRYAVHTFAQCYALPNQQYQNAVFIFAAPDDTLTYMKSRLAIIADHFQQDSIAWVDGITEMIHAKPAETTELKTAEGHDAEITQDLKPGEYRDGDGNVVKAIEVQHGFNVPRQRNRSRRFRN